VKILPESPNNKYKAMRISEILFENNVVNLSTYRKSKQIADLVKQFPDRMAEQERLEKWVNSSIDNIMQEINAGFTREEIMQIRPLVKEYAQDTLIPQMLMWHIHDKDEYTKMSKRFVNLHFDKINQLLSNAFEKMKELAAEAKAQPGWAGGPSNWSRYTRYSSKV